MMAPSKQLGRLMKKVATIDGTDKTVEFATINFYCEVGHNRFGFWLDVSADGKTAKHEGITFGTLFDIIRGIVVADYGVE